MPNAEISHDNLPVELLEAQRRIKADRMDKFKTPGTLEDSLKKLGATLAKPRQVVPDATYDAQDRLQRVDKLREAWNAPARHVSRSQLNPDAREWQAAYDSLAERVGTGFTAGLVGIRGPGKTQMGVELMRYATAALKSAYYCTAMDYFMRIKDSFNNSEERSQAEAQKFFIKPKLLIMDEMHVRSDSAWEDNMLTDLIGKRYNAMLDTVLISNQTVEQFAQSIGASIMDRMGETGGVIVASWPSFRS